MISLLFNFSFHLTQTILQILNLKLLEIKFQFSQNLIIDLCIFKLPFNQFILIMLIAYLHTYYNNKYAFLHLYHFQPMHFLIIILVILFFQKNGGRIPLQQKYSNLNFYICILCSMLQPTTTRIKFIFIENKLNFLFFLNPNQFLEYYLLLLY